MPRLNKALVAIGLVVLIAGAVFTVWAVSAKQLSVYTYEPRYETKEEWEISGNFSAGDRLNFTVIPAENWGLQAYTDPDPNGDFTLGPFLPVDISIVDPAGGKTNFTYIFAAEPGSTITILKEYGAKVVSNDGGLTMEEGNVFAQNSNKTFYRVVGGIAKYGGIYRAVVAPFFNPPRYLYLYRQKLTTELPYLSMTPYGGVAFVAGAVVSGWAVRRQPKHRSKHLIKKV